jgi:type III secretory pathway component EscU
MKKGPDLVLVLVLVFIVGFVITGVSQTGFISAALASGIAPG